MLHEEFKIAFIDIETSPNLGYTWAKYEQNVIQFEREWHLLAFAVKWAGSGRVTVHSLPDYRGYARNKTNDKCLAEDLWKVLDEADLVVAHNGDRFDLRKANARFLVHGFTPPTPYKSVDTLKLARKYFSLNSNKLNDIAQHLGIGQKAETGGFQLWLDCMKGIPKAWATMCKYNKQDVILLEKVYEKLAPWHTTHPNVAIKETSARPLCPACGSRAINRRGWNYKISYRTQRFQCQACGHWSSGPSEKLEGVHLR